MGPRSKETLLKDLEGSIYANLASQLDAQGKLEEAFAMYGRAAKLAAKEFGAAHPRVADPVLRLADIRRRQARYSEALDLYDKALQIQVRHFGDSAPQTQETRQAIAGLSSMANGGVETTGLGLAGRGPGPKAPRRSAGAEPA